METSTELLEQLKKSQSRRLVKDGIIDDETFVKSPFRILVVLKEVNLGDNTEEIRPINKIFQKWITRRKVDNNWGKTYNRLILGVNSIVTGEYNPSVQESLISFRHCAVVNVNKFGGGAQSKIKTLKAHYGVQKDILRAQLDEINPNIVICGGTYDIIHPLLKEKYNIANLKKVYFDKTIPKKSFWMGDQLIIKYFHPGYAIRNDFYALGLLSAYRSWQSEVGK